MALNLRDDFTIDLLWFGLRQVQGEYNITLAKENGNSFEGALVNMFEMSYKSNRREHGMETVVNISVRFYPFGEYVTQETLGPPPSERDEKEIEGRYGIPPAETAPPNSTIVFGSPVISFQ